MYTVLKWARMLDVKDRQRAAIPAIEAQILVSETYCSGFCSHFSFKSMFPALKKIYTSKASVELIKKSNTEFLGPGLT